MDGVLLERLAEILLTTESVRVRAKLAADVVRTATRARWVGVYTVRDGMVANEGWSGPSAPAHLTFPATRGLTSHAIQACAVAVRNDVKRDPRYLTNQDDSGSELIVPVLDGHRVIGTLDVESDRVGAFNGATIGQYEALAAVLTPLWRNDRDEGSPSQPTA
jgi:GAF domain-containing protein